MNENQQDSAPRQTHVKHTAKSETKITASMSPNHTTEQLSF